jgi:hypothetical protein
MREVGELVVVQVPEKSVLLYFGETLQFRATSNIAKGPIKAPELLLTSFLEGDVTSLDQCDLRDSPVEWLAIRCGRV